MWERSTELSLPSFIFISKLDRERASFERTMEDIRETLGGNVVPLNLPIGEEHGFRGVSTWSAERRFEHDGKGKAREIEVPGELEELLAEDREKLIEAVAEADDALLEKYLDEGEISSEEITAGLKKGVTRQEHYPGPVRFRGQGHRDTPASRFHSSSPSRCPQIFPISWAQPRKVEEEITRARTPDAPICALVFKTLADPYVGKLTYFRVFSGVFKSDSSVLNSTRSKTERVGQLFR